MKGGRGKGGREITSMCACDVYRNSTSGASKWGIYMRVMKGGSYGGKTPDPNWQFILHQLLLARQGSALSATQIAQVAIKPPRLLGIRRATAFSRINTIERPRVA